VIVNAVDLTNVLARTVLYHFTYEVLKKLEPFSVNVKVLLPAIANEGVVELRTGAVLETVKIELADDLPLHVTVTGIEPGLAMSVVSTRAVNVVLFT
jgi:hypothetical protein